MGLGATYPKQYTNVLGIVLGPSYTKYYDRSLQIITEIDYDDSSMSILDSDSPTAAVNTNWNLFGYMWRALMTQDPNWQNLVDLSTGNLDFLSGTGVVEHENLCIAIMSNIVPGPHVDFWYATTNFAKFGWFAWGAESQEMPVQFININQCYFFEPYGSFDGFGFGMADGTTCLCSTYSMLDVPFNVFQGATFNTPR